MEEKTNLGKNLLISNDFVELKIDEVNVEKIFVQFLLLERGRKRHILFDNENENIKIGIGKNIYKKDILFLKKNIITNIVDIIIDIKLGDKLDVSHFDYFIEHFEDWKCVIQFTLSFDKKYYELKKIYGDIPHDSQ